jgi:hypothetical protein
VGVRPGSPDVARQRLEQRSERHRRCRVDRPAEQHAHPTYASDVGKVACEARLADSDLADDRDESATTGGGGVQTLHQL